MKRLALLLLLIFAVDVAIDSLDADCRGVDSSQPCHACLCGTHAFDTREASSGIILAPALRRVPPSPSPLRELLLDKSTFHPPAA